MNAQKWKLAAVALLAAGLLSACQPIQPLPEAAAPTAEADAASVEIPVVTLKVTEAGLEAPSEIPSGIIAVKVEGGNPENMPELARLNDGVTIEQVNEAVAGPEPMAALALVTLLGSASSTVDGQVIYDLQPGGYVAVLFMPDGPPQVLPVISDEPSRAAAPNFDVSATLLDFAFTIPDKIAAGPHVWQIENGGEQWHEMAIVKLNEGVTVEDVLAWVQSMGPEGPSGPPPFEEGAFWAPMGAGQRAWVHWDIAPGEYTVICFLPDLAGDMSPHAVHGMVRTLVVE